MFFANDEEQVFPEWSGSESSIEEASAAFSAGLYRSGTIIVTISDHILKTGAKCVNSNCWCVWDNFELTLVSLSSEQNVTVQIGDVGYATMYYSVINLKTTNIGNVPPIPYTVTVNSAGRTVRLNEVPMQY